MHFSTFSPLGVKEASMLNHRIGPARRENLLIVMMQRILKLCWTSDPARCIAQPAGLATFFEKMAAVKEIQHFNTWRFHSKQSCSPFSSCFKCVSRYWTLVWRSWAFLTSNVSLRWSCNQLTPSLLYAQEFCIRFLCIYYFILLNLVHSQQPFESCWHWNFLNTKASLQFWTPTNSKLFFFFLFICLVQPSG